MTLQLQQQAGHGTAADPSMDDLVRARRPGSARRFAGARARGAARWALALLIVAAGLHRADSPSPKAESADLANTPPAPLHWTTALKRERPQDRDRLWLDNGEERVGVVLETTLELRTAYGVLTLETRRLAGLDLAAGTGGLDVVWTVNSNRLSGLLTHPSFALDEASGRPSIVRRETVHRIRFRRRAAELEGLPQGHWLRLRNGDWLSGRVLADPLPLTGSGGARSVALADLARLVMRDEKSPERECTVALHNGARWEATLELEDIPIRLDVGPQLTLYGGWVAALGANPTAIDPQARTAPPGPIPRAQPPPPPHPEALAGLVWIPPGRAWLGSPNDESGRDQDEGPVTEAIFPDGFWIGRCEVTQAEYKAVMGVNPSIFTGDPTRPVEKVSWREAVEYCARLTQQARAAGRLSEGYAYRLPTEAEWEYACRAGSTTRFAHGDDPDYGALGEYAWYMENSKSSTHPVGAKRPNDWGLFDLHGNVWEWCLDRWESGWPGGTIANTPVAASGALRVARGGSWLYDGRASRSANRDDYSPTNRCSDVGFRVVLAR